MIKTVMRTLAVTLFILSIIGMCLVNWMPNWKPKTVTVDDLWFLTACVMLTILSKGK